MKKKTETVRIDIDPRPAGTVAVRTLYGEDNAPEMVFMRFGKNGTQDGALFEFIGRLITRLLELGITLDEIKKQAKGMTIKGLPSLPEVILTQIKSQYDVIDE